MTQERALMDRRTLGSDPVTRVKVSSQRRRRQCKHHLFMSAAPESELRERKSFILPSN